MFFSPCLHSKFPSLPPFSPADSLKFGGKMELTVRRPQASWNEGKFLATLRIECYWPRVVIPHDANSKGSTRCMHILDSAPMVLSLQPAPKTTSSQICMRRPQVSWNEGKFIATLRIECYRPRLVIPHDANSKGSTRCVHILNSAPIILSLQPVPKTTSS